jgi:phenylalanyl-tRNA synthetase beta chain
MTISYNWLSEYLPEIIEPEKLSKILTSIGLEVESLEKFESVKGGLEGLVIGEVLECEKHPNADKLSVTKVNVGSGELLQIVCGAPNVAVGQKVVVATVGTTIYPSTGEPLTMRVAKIRSVESYGMICAEDEIGLGASHAGILILPNDVLIGTKASDYFKPYSDWVYEIGLTPNRMDAMSHLGVAKDVCAYLTHHQNGVAKVKTPYTNNFKADNITASLKVTVENTDACARYTGVSINNIKVADSPKWLKDKLLAIGVRSINNIVDISNYILHETGQPLHAFDASEIAGNHIIVKCLPEGTNFISLDEKERKLAAADLMICDGNNQPMCIAGVFGGIKSGVKENTTNIFLESAWFNNISVRKTSLHHNLRTDAATRFEKGVDISNTVNVLKRAALLIKEVAGGEISCDIIDIYPNPKAKTPVSIKYHYIKKISGKNYHPDAVKKILEALGFEVLRDGIDELQIAVPFSKPDISLPADIVEEILRIDGIDSIEIPTTITLSPSINTLASKERLKDKIANYLVGQGFNEILTNSITNSKYYTEEVLAQTVKMVNSLSVDLDIMRPSLLETGLETISFNMNRRNNNLQFFEIGKTYLQKEVGFYKEEEHLALYLTGNNHEDEWREKSKPNDLFRAKGIAASILTLGGFNDISFAKSGNIIEILNVKQKLGTLEEVAKNKLNQFDIKQAVIYIDIEFGALLKATEKQKIVYKEVPKFPAVQRDLALIVDSNVQFDDIENIVTKQKNTKLQSARLFDVFESDKLGVGKKSMAINFTFLDEEKTLTDKEVEGMTNRLIKSFEKEIGAEIRK